MLLQSEASTDSGTLQSPLLWVSGAIHAFRAIDRWRHVAHASTSPSIRMDDEPSPSPGPEYQPRQDLQPQQLEPLRGAHKTPQLLQASSPSPNLYTCAASTLTTQPAPLFRTPQDSPDPQPSSQAPAASKRNDRARLPSPGHIGYECHSPLLGCCCCCCKAPSCEKDGSVVPHTPPDFYAYDSPSLAQSDISWEALAAMYVSRFAGYAGWSSGLRCESAPESASSVAVSSSSLSADFLGEAQALSTALSRQPMPSLSQPKQKQQWKGERCRGAGAGAGEGWGWGGGQAEVAGASRVAQMISTAILRDSHHLGTRGAVSASASASASDVETRVPHLHPAGWRGKDWLLVAPLDTWVLLSKLSSSNLGNQMLGGNAVRDRHGEGKAVIAGRAKQEQGADAAGALEGLHVQAATVLAGAFSRTAAQVAVHPLDTLKTRMQVRLQNPQLHMWRIVMAAPLTRLRILAAWAGAAGVRDLLLGVGAAVVGVLPSSALYFAAEPQIRSWLEETLAHGRESSLCRLAASAAAATLSALIRVPADVVKHRVQAYAFPSSSRAARAILETHGPVGLYRGFGATLLRDVPEIVIQFTVYRKLKALMEQMRRGAASDGVTATAALPSSSEHLLLGGAAGAAAALATTPLDVIKTQLQCGAATSVPAATMQIWCAGGPAALFGGLAPRLMQATMFSALFFMCFEASKTRLGHFWRGTATASLVPNSQPMLPPSPPPVLLQQQQIQQQHQQLQATVVVSAGAQEAAAVLSAATMPQRGLMQGPLPELPPRRQPKARCERACRHVMRGLSGGDDAAAAATTANAASNELPRLVGRGHWAAVGTLTPVALYAYAFAGAAAPDGGRDGGSSSGFCSNVAAASS